MSQYFQRPILHGRDHLPDGPDPIPGLPDASGNDIEDIILSYGPAAFWKLDESSGDVAHDSSGNNHHLEPVNGIPAEWGQEVAPTGKTSALFVDDDNEFNQNADVAMSAFTNNFTAGIWFSFSSNPAQNNELIGQGAGSHSAGGWTLGLFGAVATVLINGDSIVGNNTLSQNTWYFAACVRDAGTFKLYINGLVQTDTMTTSFTGDTNSWIGNDGFASHTSYSHDMLLSFGFIIDDVLTGDQLLELYESGFSGGAIGAGKVWTADGEGGASWQYPTIEVEY